jgi:hypothetical protein
MASDNGFGNSFGFINPIERSLLSDLVGLYTCDLTRELHVRCHARCIACSKEAIVRAISRYCELDEYSRARNFSVSPAPPIDQ